MRNGRMRLAVAALALALTACGGGGGGGDAGTASGGGTTNPSNTALIPVAPAIGATLYADASALRPLKSGARWDYRGTAVVAAGATPVAYTTATTHSAVTADGAVETASNLSNTGVDTLQLTLSGGTVGSQQSVDFAGKGNRQDVNFIELRSPVRTGDQYTILDQRFTDTAIDADGDGKPDALDVAIYARVVGSETVSPPNLPSLNAVRVDTFVLLRVTLSSTGQFSPVTQANLRTWYVAGIGIVRQVTTLPSASGTDVSTTDEVLASWDGITAGLGAMPPVAAFVPAGNAVFAGQALPSIRGRLFAFAFDDHTLVLSDPPGIATGTLASRIDVRGNVLATTHLAGVRIFSSQSVAAHADGVVSIEPIGSGAVKDYSLTRLDRRGELVGAPRGATLNLGGAHVMSFVNSVALTADGSTIWLLWSRTYFNPGVGNGSGAELVLRPFALDGSPLGSERIIEPALGGGSPQIAARDGQVLMTWTLGVPNPAVKFGSASLSGDVVTRTLASGLASSLSFVTPLRLGANGALLWSFAPGTGLPLDAMHGVLLDATLTPVLSVATLLEERLANVMTTSGVEPTASGSRIVSTSTRTAALWPTIAETQPVDHVSWLDTRGTSLAGTPVVTVRMPSSAPQLQVALPDRVLLFGGNTQLTTTVVWLNAGTSP